jgi:flagellar biosynthesis chaperone FliJ
MEDPCKLYKSQYKKAKEALEILEKHQTEIEQKLETDHINSDLHKELRNVNMEIKITQNEIEHAEYSISKCESNHTLQ